MGTMRRTARSTATAAAATLRRAGLRATAPRVALLAWLEGDRSHPTVEQLHEALRVSAPTLSLSTVYEALQVFARAGLCRRISFGDGRIRVDGTADDHDHAVCIDCGRLFDVARGHAPVPKVPRRLPHGLSVRGVRLEYDVVCPKCNEAPRSPERTSIRRAAQRTRLTGSRSSSTRR